MKIQKITASILLLVFTLNTLAATTTPTITTTATLSSCNLIPNSQTCVDTTPCKTLDTGYTVCLAGTTPPTGGFNVTQTCWQYQYQYACSTSTIDTCSDYRNNPNCTLLNSICQDVIQETNQCDQWQYSYQCQIAGAVTKTQTICGDPLLDNLKMPTPNNANTHFAQAALAQEIINQGGTYLQNGLFFTGVQEKCTRGYLGLKNCCKGVGGAKSNSVFTEILFGATASVVKYAGESAIDWASPYVFDAMYNNGIFTKGLLSSFNLADASGTIPVLGTDLASGGLSISAYGLSLGTSETAGLLGANTTIGEINGMYLQFNPYAFAASVLFSYLMSLLSCSSEEQLFMLHKGANLSAFIKSKCTTKILGFCLEHTDTYCSFNSVLAEIINIQGKQQLGLDISNCQGITVQQLSQIDFTRIDFGPFTQSLMQNARNHQPSSINLNNSYAPVMQNTNNGTGQTKYSPNAPAY